MKLQSSQKNRKKPEAEGKRGLNLLPWTFILLPLLFSVSSVANFW